MKAIPDLQLNIEDIFATEDRVASYINVSGTHKGELWGVSPTNKEVKYNQVNLYWFEGEKLAEQWALVDAASLLRQIGVLTF